MKKRRCKGRIEITKMNRKNRRRKWRRRRKE